MLIKAQPRDLPRKQNTITITAVDLATGETSHHTAIFHGPKGHEDNDD
jgi:hypothetical protein